MPVVKNIDKNEIMKMVKGNKELGQYAAEAWQKRVEPYIPYRTGRLCKDVTISPYKITYNAPYAGKVYNDLKTNFNKEKHPLATARWNEVAAPVIMQYFIQDLQEFVDRINFNG